MLNKLTGTVSKDPVEFFVLNSILSDKFCVYICVKKLKLKIKIKLT